MRQDVPIHLDVRSRWLGGKANGKTFAPRTHATRNAHGKNTPFAYIVEGAPSTWRKSDGQAERKTTRRNGENQHTLEYGKKTWASTREK